MYNDDYKIAKNALKDIPDIREEKIKEVKEKINMNLYENNKEKIIEDIIKKMFKNI